MLAATACSAGPEALRSVLRENHATCDGTSIPGPRCDDEARGVVHLQLVSVTTAGADADGDCLVRRPHVRYTIVGACLRTVREGRSDADGIIREPCLPDDHYYAVVEREPPQIVAFTYNADTADPAYADPTMTPLYAGVAYCGSER